MTSPRLSDVKKREIKIEGNWRPASVEAADPSSAKVSFAVADVGHRTLQSGGRKKERGAQGTHQRSRSLFPRLTLSCAPFFPAHYFQAPTTQAKDWAIIGENGLLKILV